MKKVSEETFVDRRVLERIAEIEREIGKGIFLSIVAAAMLGKLTFDPLDVVFCCVVFVVGAVFIKTSLSKTRQAAKKAYEEEL